MADATSIRLATAEDAALLAGIGLAVDAETDWVLGGVRCAIVRFRLDWPAGESP